MKQIFNFDNAATFFFFSVIVIAILLVAGVVFGFLKIVTQMPENAKFCKLGIPEVIEINHLHDDTYTAKYTC